MRQLPHSTIQSERLYYLTPDGQEYMLHGGAARTIYQLSGDGLPPINYITQQGPQQHGATVVDYRLEPRTVQMTYGEFFCSRQAYWDGRGGATMLEPNIAYLGGYKRKEIAGLLDAIRPNRYAAPRPGTFRRVLPDGSRRDLDVFIQSGPGFTPHDPALWAEWSFEEVLEFVAYDPVWYDPDEETQVFASGVVNTELCFPFCVGCGAHYLHYLPYCPDEFAFGTEVSINQIVEVTYPGTWLTYPTIEATGPITSLRIRNLTTGEKLEFQAGTEIVAGQVVTFDLRYGYKTVQDQAGNNFYPYLTSDSDMATFHLAPHAEANLGINRIECYGLLTATGSNVVLRWHVRYIGI